MLLIYSCKSENTCSVDGFFIPNFNSVDHIIKGRIIDNNEILDSIIIKSIDSKCMLQLKNISSANYADQLFLKIFVSKNQEKTLINIIAKKSKNIIPLELPECSDNFKKVIERFEFYSSSKFSFNRGDYVKIDDTLLIPLPLFIEI